MKKFHKIDNKEQGKKKNNMKNKTHKKGSCFQMWVEKEAAENFELIPLGILHDTTYSYSIVHSN